MELPPIRHRRARRTDADAVRTLLSDAGIERPPDDRAGLRRFRHLVADLGGDLYLAERDARLVGLVHVTYSRHLLEGQRATLALLVVTPIARRRGVGAGLVALATARARRRGCPVLACPGSDAADDGRDWLRRLGWHEAGTHLLVDLAGATG
jgi:N-acetylglutamate synthase-like GNAT family acetyltransferase